MCGKTLWGTWVFGCCLALLPAQAQAQQYAPADPQVPIPYGSTRPEDGGMFTFAQFGMYRQTNPLRNQVVAVRGLYAYDTGGQIFFENVRRFLPPLPPNNLIGAFRLTPLNTDVETPDLSFDTGPPPAGTTTGQQIIAGIILNFSDGLLTAIPNIQVAGQNIFRRELRELAGLFDSPGFVGSGETALDVSQLHQRNSYQPSVHMGLGWKMRDGSAISLSWLYVSEAQYRAGATLAPQVGPGLLPDNVLGARLENTFLFSPVFNFPTEYAGADFKVAPQPGTVDLQNRPISANAQTAFGIWNAATIMTIEFRQRFQQWDITYREPIWETENYRLNGLAGGRFSWIWEKFKWVTTSLGVETSGTADTADDITISGPQNVGIYSNVVSNRMYGPFIGCEQEWYLGHGFAVHLTGVSAILMNTVKERAKYETAAKYLGLPENKNARHEWTAVPQLQAKLGLMWYPTEFVQLYANYDFMTFFNTVASPRPIDFDYMLMSPGWTHVNRIFDGWNAGVAFTW